MWFQTLSKKIIKRKLKKTAINIILGDINKYSSTGDKQKQCKSIENLSTTINKLELIYLNSNQVAEKFTFS
jgi:hypothetical protein